MVIFRIISNLFRLVTRSLFGLLWLPVTLVTRNLYLVLVLLLIVVIYAQSKDPSAPRNQPPRQARSLKDKNGRMVVEPVTKRENGDSDFATDLYASMSDEERSAYSGYFYQAMATQPDGGTLTWSHYNISGAIRPTDHFLNSAGGTCRRFGEILKVHRIEQRLTGIACVKADDSWCKLKPNATPACDLGHEPGMLEGISRSLGNIF